MGTKNFYDFFIEKPRKDLFGPFGEFIEYIDDAMENKEYAYRRTLASSTSSNVTIQDKGVMIMLGANNYLDLASDERVVNAARDALNKYGYGSGSVALFAGTFEIHRKLENKIARFYERKAAAIFPTGYSVNVGTISALIQKNDLVLLDMYSHASLVDGTRLTEGTVKYFKHNDMNHLERLLKKLRDRYDGVLIVTDGVFSMDGDLCKLNELLRIKKEYNARLMIDEAHAVGIIGETGRGTEEYFGRIGEVDIIAGTLSKAPAGLGGYVTGSREMVEYVRHFANSYIFSTSLPPSVVGGLIEVFNIFENDLSRMKALHRNIDRFTGRLRKLGLNIGETITAIVPVIIGDENITKQIAKEMALKNIFCSAVVFPAVSKTQSRLRLSLMATHTDAQIDYVLDTLEELCKKYGVIK